jgi:hypothetical protein
MAAKKYGEACPKFEESERLDPGIGAMYNLADCWDHSGRTASAWAMFLDTAAAARAANQPEREHASKERASAIEGKVAHVTMQVASGDSGLEVKRDGVVVGAASYGVPVPVDPGSHHFEASEPGKKTYAVDVAVAAAAAVSVQIPKLEDAPAAATAAVTAPEATRPAVSEPPPSSSPPQAKSKAPGYALLSVGVVGAVVATVFEIKSRSANSDALKICLEGQPCSSNDVSHHDSLVSNAKTDRTIAVVGLGVGAVGVATGMILLATSHAAPEVALRNGWHLQFAAGPQGAAAIAEGRF